MEVNLLHGFQLYSKLMPLTKQLVLDWWNWQHFEYQNWRELVENSQIKNEWKTEGKISVQN